MLSNNTRHACHLCGTAFNNAGTPYDIDECKCKSYKLAYDSHGNLYIIFFIFMRGGDHYSIRYEFNRKRVVVRHKFLDIKSFPVSEISFEQCVKHADSIINFL